MAAARLVGLVVVVAVLYFAREVLIPLALALLLAFLLAPAVRLLERLKLGRVGATLVAALLVFSVIGAVGWLASSQALSLAGKLPEYRANIVEKIAALRRPGRLSEAAKALEELQQQAQPEQPRAPLPVTQAPESPWAQLVAFVAPFARPAATALAVIVFTILMLLHRENLRERLIALAGQRRLNVTTQAIGEASHRVSRYLFMQVVVNASFGIPFGAALYFIGIPNALLWGLLGMLLRFIPYIGVWVAVSMPALLAFAISDSWAPVLQVVGVFLALELLLANFVEPFLYGRSAGLAPLAVIVAAMFWTWMWGPVGLLLATPLTVCLSVIGRHIPELGFFNVLFGVEPVLAPEARFYQRLVAMDSDEAEDLAEDYANEHGLRALHAEVTLPALRLVEQDRHAGALDEPHQRFIFDTTRRIVEYVEDRSPQAPPPRPAAARPARTAPTICIVAAHDEADHVAALVLARVLEGPEFRTQVIDFPRLASEIVDDIAAAHCRLVCISAVPPDAASHAAYLAKRLRQRLPQTEVVVALWTHDDLERPRERLRRAGVEHLVGTLEDAVRELRELGAPLELELQQSLNPA